MVPVYSTPSFPPISDLVSGNQEHVPVETTYSGIVSSSQSQLMSTSSQPLSENIQFQTVGPPPSFPAPVQPEPEPVAPTTDTIGFQLPAVSSAPPEFPSFPTPPAFQSSFEPVRNERELQPALSSAPFSLSPQAPPAGNESILQPLLPSAEAPPRPVLYEVAYNQSGDRANICLPDQVQIACAHASGILPLAMPYGGLAGPPQ